MAWLALFPSRPDELQLDLHGYRYHSGERVVRAKIVEAQANGFGALRVIHGHSTSGHDFAHPSDGTLKAAVLAVCRERAIAGLLDREPFVGDAATTIRLRPAGRPQRPPRWTSLPRPEYATYPPPPPGAAGPGELPLFAPPPA